MSDATRMLRSAFSGRDATDQSTSTLILGQERLPCRLVEISTNGFCVKAPLSTPWTGNPVCKLQTADASYPVRILNQTAEYDGFLMKLQRTNVENLDELPHSQRWIVHASRCCTIGMIAGLTYCFAIAPQSGYGAQGRKVTLKDVANYWFWSPTSTTSPSSAGKSSKSSWFPSMAWGSTSGSGTAEAPSTAPPAAGPAVLAEQPRPIVAGLPTAPIASGMQSRPSAPAPVLPPASGVALATSPKPVTPAAPTITRASAARSAINQQSNAPTRPVNQKTLPWLFAGATDQEKARIRCRVYRAAENDLKSFEEGLKQLPRPDADDAVKGLRKTLTDTVEQGEVTPEIKGLPGVHQLAGRDAEILFRHQDGEVEILRVLPAGHLTAFSRSLSADEILLLVSR